MESVVAAAVLRQARNRAGLTLRAAATVAGTSHSTLAAYENGRKSPTMDTFLRVLAAYGYAADVHLSARVRKANGSARGDELKAVLDLAAAFPARHDKQLIYPRFGVR